MTWSYNEIRIFVQDRVIDADQIIARLNPLSGGTILHAFGSDERIDKLNAYIVGLDDWRDLYDSRDGASHWLTSPGGSGLFMLKHFTSKDVMTTCQTLRTDLPEDSPVFIVDLELYIDA